MRREWRARSALLQKCEALQKRFRVGSSKHRHCRRVAAVQRARLAKLAAFANATREGVRKYNAVKNKRTTVVLRGRYANDDTLRKIVAELQSGKRRLGVPVYKSD